MTDLIDQLEKVNQKLAAQVVVDPIMFGQILDALPDGLLVINEDGIIQLVNQQIELLFGYSRSQLISEPVHMLLQADTAAVHSKHISQYFAHPTVRPMNLAKSLPGRHRSGRIITVQISLGPVVSNEGVLALALVRRISDGA
jgi:PAS domain S-box-containing protein